MSTVQSVIKEIKASITNEFIQWHGVGAIIEKNGPSDSSGKLTWTGCNLNGLTPGATYRDEFDFLSKNNQYLFKTVSGGLIQISFEFAVIGASRKAIVCAKSGYAFFPPPAQGNRAEFRIEADLTSYRLGFHPRVHFQSSGFGNLRQTCAAIPRVEIFLDTIIRHWEESAWGKRFPEAYAILQSQNANFSSKKWDSLLWTDGNVYGHLRTEKDQIDRQLRQSDYGKFLDAQSKLGPLVKIDLTRIEGQGLVLGAHVL